MTDDVEKGDMGADPVEATYGEGSRGSGGSKAASTRTASTEDEAGEPMIRSYDPKEEPEFDIDDPGPWLTWFHRNALIIEIKKPEPTLLSTMKDVSLKYHDAVIEKYLRVLEYRDRFVHMSPEDREKMRSGRREKTRPKRPKPADPLPRRVRISIAELQRMYLRKLQIQLAKDAVDMRYSLEEATDWEKHLREYTQALRDYDYMNECGRRTLDPFLISGERWIDNMVLGRSLESVDDDAFYDWKFETYYSAEPWREDDDNSPIGGVRERNNADTWSRGLHRRLLVAVLGGFLLLGPMWLMVLHHTKYTALISTTVCVAVFGLCMCFYLEKENDVLSSTAAYAAVLVVFVGLNTQ